MQLSFKTPDGKRINFHTCPFSSLPSNHSSRPLQTSLSRLNGQAVEIFKYYVCNQKSGFIVKLQPKVLLKRQLDLWDRRMRRKKLNNPESRGKCLGNETRVLVMFSRCPSCRLWRDLRMNVNRISGSKPRQALQFSRTDSHF